MTEKDGDKIRTLTSSISRISLEKLFEWRDTPSHSGSCPHEPVDYGRATNPYLSRYRESREDEIKCNTFIK